MKKEKGSKKCEWNLLLGSIPPLWGDMDYPRIEKFTRAQFSDESILRSTFTSPDAEFRNKWSELRTESGMTHRRYSLIGRDGVASRDSPGRLETSELCAMISRLRAL